MTAVDPILSSSASYEINYEGPGLDVRPLVQPGWQTQGVTYSEDTDSWFVTEVTDTATPSTIHELTEAGVLTGNSFQFPTRTSTPNHANALQWHNGDLWCSEYNSDTIYRINWANKAVLGRFTLGGGVIDPDKLGAIEFIPTSEGTYKLLCLMWGQTSQNAYLINYEDAIADGTATGNVFRILTDTIDTGRFQGLHYNDGALYLNHDNCPNGDPPSAAGWGSYATIKAGFPFADSFAEGDPVLDGRYVWEWLNEQISYDDPIQDISFNPSTGTFWIVSEGTGTIYSGQEGAAVNTLPDAWNDWTTTARAGPNNEWTRSLELDNAIASGKRSQHLYLNGQPADVEVWIYDDLADVGTTTEKRAYVSCTSPKSAYNSNEHALAINSSQSETDYFAWNATDSWHTTGVRRPATPQWVKWRWVLDGTSTTTYLSKDGGETWTQSGTYTYGATTLGELQPQVSTGVPTELGPFKITPIT